MRYIVCIADARIERNLHEFVCSLRVQGWSAPVYVFSPSGSTPASLPEGCILTVATAWWRFKGSKATAPNAAALLKPSIFLDKRWNEGDQILYADCSDMVFLCPPNVIFDLAEGSSLAAKRHLNMDLSTCIPRDTCQKLGLRDRWLGKGVTVNSGLIVATIGPYTIKAMQTWQEICGTIPKKGSLFKASKGKIGDQAAFAYVWRNMTEKGITRYLPAAYNYNGGKEVHLLRIEGGRLINPDGEEVFVPHASGKCELPPEIIELATKQKGNTSCQSD